MTRRTLPFAALALTVAASPAHAEWHEASTDHFLIYADASEDWVRQYADRLERFDAVMRIVRNVPARPGDKANRVTVYVVDDIDAVRQLYSRKVSQVGGFYIPRVTSVAFVPRENGRSRSDLNGDTVLYHEYAHHIMMRNTRIALPKWYSEGFAEVFAAALVANDGRVDVGRQAGHRAYSLLNAQTLPIEKLLVGEDGGNGDLFYGRSWLLAHMMTFDPARKGQLSKYLGLLASGTPNLDAAKAAFGDLRVLDRAIDTYMSRPLTYTTFNADRVKPGPITLRALSPGEAAIMPVRMRSDRGVDDAEAKRVLVDARRIAAPYASDAAVQATLAEAEYDAGNDAEADAAADRAIAADARNVDALLYKGRIAERRATKAGKTDADTWKGVRSWYIKAAAARPDAAEPLMLFYQTYGGQGIAPTPNAAAALQRAFENAPQDRTLRFAAARQMLHDGRAQDARATLVPLAFDPHAKGQNNFAAKLVKMIDDGEPADKVAAAKPDTAGESDTDGQGDGS